MADTTMDPAAVQAAGAAAEQLSTQVSGFKPQLAQAAGEAAGGVPKTATAGSIQTSGGAWDQAITKLSTDMDQQGLNLKSCAARQSGTESDVAGSLNAIQAG
ncbi:hypothetical protein P3T35_003743 [Kitasatospora sp. GP30]|uniref:hypothetical protein n=1 Tax=Kitasatospora sp. GP30 TaxID=3035084 RepID=UPI000C704BF9|nr:hypothetical protein [Kitasatospora sp. GP30]MDH6141722.1 hypothetical protein [Kitasatospora sp. GP30]